MVFNRFERFTSFQATPLRGGNLTGITVALLPGPADSPGLYTKTKRYDQQCRQSFLLILGHQELERLPCLEDATS